MPDEAVALFIQQILNGLSIGSIYALVALGYTMVYGILGFINFAHGDFYMLGAYGGFIALTVLKVDLIPAMILAMLFSGTIAFVVEKIAYRPLRTVSRFAPMISSLGVSLTLQTLVLIIMGARTKGYNLDIEFTMLNILGTKVSVLQIIILVVALSMMLGLDLLVNKTQVGTAMRACAENLEAATLLGVNLDRIISLTFFLGGALGGGAGVLVGIYYNAISPTMGAGATMRAFTAAVLGGIGSIRGAMLGGLLLGLMETFGTMYLSSSWTNAISFAVLIIVLLVKPTGLLGAKLANRA